jgi:alpha-N-acetylglucosaminidase
MPAAGVIERTLGRPAASHFRFTDLPKRADGLDQFTVEAKDGTVFIAGTSPVAQCRAAYEYLKDACRLQMTWSTMDVKAPRRFPDYARREVVTPFKYRHYFNICTFGYTTAWWDKARWEKEIDWMALHGINMPLALNGQDMIWRRVLEGMGLSRASVNKFFSGPAFNPWHWMGNLNAHMGPPPESWMKGQVDLQKSILKRERELGMTPVVSGFSGFVPTDFNKVFPNVKLQSPTAWAGFEPTTFVDARDPIFVEIGKRYVTEYQKEFGPITHFLCDTFNEQDPQFPKETEIADLAECGRAVFESLHAANPDAVWVMQGWLFYNARNYWSNARADALVSKVPQDRMIILDLATTEFEVWKTQPALPKTGWIFNLLHNYGQNTALQGDLARIEQTVNRTLRDPKRGKLLGAGLTMEGIDQNPIVYELMTDLMWPSRSFDLDRWLAGYVDARYGDFSPSAQEAWRSLVKMVYSGDNAWGKVSWRGRPNANRIGQPSGDFKLLAANLRKLLADAPRFANNPRYQRDLVDFTKTWLGGLADVQLSGALGLAKEKPAASREHRKAFFEILAMIDQVMACRPEHRLSTWINSARTWGNTRDEKDQMERNARMQVTVWGGPYLADYANKEWAGLTNDFLAARWKAFFDAQDAKKVHDGAAWELKWAMTPGPIRESRPGDAVTVCTQALDRFSNLETNVAKILGVDDRPGIAVGKPVRDSGGTEGGGQPKWIVDGITTGRFWAASPAPQWVEIDLEQPTKVSEVHLYPYCGDERVYRYKVEGSTDGKSWTMLVDGSKSDELSSIRGYRHRFPTQEVRFVRVTMLWNSANVGVHLHEVRLFP